jgi:hypothetical protein
MTSALIVQSTVRFAAPARCAAMAVLFWLSASLGFGQQAVQSTPFKGTGKVVSHTPGLLVVTLATGAKQEVRYCQPGKDNVELSTKQKIQLTPIDVQVTGALAPDQLRPGRGVRFRAGIDAKGLVPEPISEVTLIQLKLNDTFGCFPDGEAVDGVAPYAVKGSILSYKKGSMTVNVAGSNTVGGKNKLALKLAPEIIVMMESQDIAHVVPGSDVEIDGGQIGKDVIAQKLVVTLPTPPGVKPPKKKQPAAPPAAGPKQPAPAAQPPADGDGPRRVKRDKPGRIIIVN